MELGLTFPLQRFLKRKSPAYGIEPDRRFCWDLHVIDLQGRKCLLAVHCHSRYTFVRYDVTPFQWTDLPGLFREGFLDSLTAAGFAQAQAEDYLGRAGATEITRTHGRREVAFLNRAWEDVLALDLCLDTTSQAQPLLDHAVNARPSRCVGFEGLGTGLERMAAMVNQWGGSCYMEECLICKARLEYLTQDEAMECAICHKKEPSKTRCMNGHYVCSDCHTQGMDSIFGLCLSETSIDPVAIIRRMMDLPFCHMHGPEHHVMVGAALLTAYKNAGGDLDLEKALREIYSRGKAIPGGVCGFWGACGAGISAGQFLAIVTQSTPLAGEPWGMSNQMTARALDSIGKTGGPRCCKRDSFLAILAAIDFAREHLGVEMKRTVPICSYSSKNNQCMGGRCPFSASNGGKEAELQVLRPVRRVKVVKKSLR